MYPGIRKIRSFFCSGQKATTASFSAAVALFSVTITHPATTHATDWKPAEQISTYNISGKTGAELYESIGSNGPTAGLGRAVAHTTFRLTWRRDYRPQADGSCILARAVPNLVIIYTLPKVRGKLPAAVQASWQTFSSGVEAHERVHGEHILEMVQKIAAYSNGLRAENDSACQKVRAVLQKRLGELSNEQRRRSSDFDRLELGSGGNVHQLILNLVNGP